MSKCETLVATPQLRFKTKYIPYRGFVDVLQQYWTDPLNVSGKGEWRDVPTIGVKFSKGGNETPIIHCDGD